MRDTATTDVVGLFENRQEAERAVDDLYSLGYDADRVGYVDRYRDDHGEETRGNTDPERGYGDEPSHDRTEDVADEAVKGAGGGAVGGAAVGAGAGLLAAAGIDRKSVV